MTERVVLGGPRSQYGTGRERDKFQTLRTRTGQGRVVQKFLGMRTERAILGRPTEP